MAEVVKLTEKSAAVIGILRDAGDKMFAHEIADVNPDMFTKGSKSVSPIMTHLVRNGYVDKEKAAVTLVDAEGKEATKELTRYWLTDEGVDLEFEIKAA